MVEQWSSKSHARVRFLLSLIIQPPLRIFKNRPSLVQLRAANKHQNRKVKKQFFSFKIFLDNFSDITHSPIFNTHQIFYSNKIFLFTHFLNDYLELLNFRFLFKNSYNFLLYFSFYQYYNKNLCKFSSFGQNFYNLKTAKPIFPGTFLYKANFFRRRFFPAVAVNKISRQKSKVNIINQIKPRQFKAETAALLAELNYLRILNQLFIHTDETYFDLSIYVFDKFFFSNEDEVKISWILPSWSPDDFKISFTKFLPTSINSSILNVNALIDNNFEYLSILPEERQRRRPRWETSKKIADKSSHFVVPSHFSLFTNKTANVNIDRFFLSNAIFNFSSISKIIYFVFNPYIFKTLIFSSQTPLTRNFINFLGKKFYSEFNNVFFFDRKISRPLNNLFADKSFSFFIKKRLLRIINKIKYKSTTTPWFFQLMVRFFIFCTGKRVLLKLTPFISGALSFTEQAHCLKWALKVRKYQKLLGSSLFLTESFQIIYLTFKLKDPYILANWLTKILLRISFWKSRVLLSYLKYLIKHFFLSRFEELHVKGIKLQLSGKVSVAGNARTRTLRFKLGWTGQSKFENRVLTTLNLLSTFTGAQGLKIWLFF